MTADVGRNLWISSRQDSDSYDMKQTGSSAGISETWGADAGVSGSVSASRDRMNSNFDSVKEQSGIFAESGGFKKYSDSVTEKSHDVAQITSARMFTAGSDGGLLYGPRSPKYGKTAL